MVDAWVPFGVVGPPLTVVLDERAVRGAGPLIKDFLGVSVNGLLRLPIGFDEVVCLLVVIKTFGRRPEVRNGWRIAACGLIRRSGSHTRHFDMKSTNSSSLQRRTCANDLVPGLRLRPFEFMTVRGAPFVSKQGLS